MADYCLVSDNPKMLEVIKALAEYHDVVCQVREGKLYLSLDDLKALSDEQDLGLDLPEGVELEGGG